MNYTKEIPLSDAIINNLLELQIQLVVMVGSA